MRIYEQQRIDHACTCGRAHPDEHGTRIVGVPVWVWSLAVVTAGVVALLTYTAAVR